jgi:4-coumarate--CoA ligase
MTIHTSPFPPVDDPGGTITERVFRDHAGHEDAPALIDGSSGRVLSIGALAEGVRRLAGGLSERGFGPGSVTAILAPNLPEYAVVFHGVAWAGGTLTTINPTYTPPEVRHQLIDSGAGLLVTVAPFLDTARAAAEGTAVREIAVIGEAPPGATPLSALMGAPQPAQTPVDRESHVAVLPYSSGTTGLPKGVMLTHRNLVMNVEQGLGALRLARGERAVAFLPFFHIYGQTVFLNLYLARGAVPVTMPRFDLPEFLRLVSEHRTPRIWCVPPVALALARHPVVDQFDLGAVRHVCSAAAPADGALTDAVAARLGVEAAQAYGMTELSPISHVSPEGASKPGSSGVAVPSTECRIVDPETGEDRPPGVEGELWIRGPQVMKGYHNRPEATAATITPDGWLRTGDLAVIDADGHLFIRDRVKELIKVKGFQVPPAEVEAALVACPGVADAAVVPRPDEEAGEVPVAFVVAAPGAPPDAEAILAALAGRLASYKRPAEIRFVEAIPKSASGKILRRVLREQI